MAQVVYTMGTGKGSLFAGRKFWLSWGLPLRNHYIDLVKSNGGEIVPTEQAADIKIVDHLKKNLPPDSYSYTYIDQSIRRRELQDLEDHRAGPGAGAPRPVGSWKPTKGTRHPFSSEDDRQLYDWVTSHERSGGKVAGNLIYQQLEQTNPRHPWQSWRDRWVKHLSHRATPPEAPADHPPTQSADQAVDRSPREKAQKPEKATRRDEEKVSLGVTSGGPPSPVSTSERVLKGTSPPSRDARSKVTSTVSGKRKRSDMNEEAGASEGPAPRAAKQTEPQRKEDGDREIPSTPELGPSSPPATGSSQAPPLPGSSKGEDSVSGGVHLLGQVMSQSLTDQPPDSQWHEQTTQTLLGCPTEVIDLELAEPEGGWDSLLDDEMLQHEGHMLTQPSQPQDTQALLQGPTQTIDFELAEPEGGWDGIIAKTASQQPSQNAIDTERQLGTWIDAHVAAGASEDDVLLSLKCSSMHTGLAELVLDSLARDEGVPEDVKGIWTEREDEALKGGDGRAIKMLEEKHGKEAFQARWVFLANYDQIDD